MSASAKYPPPPWNKNQRVGLQIADFCFICRPIVHLMKYYLRDSLWTATSSNWSYTGTKWWLQLFCLVLLNHFLSNFIVRKWSTLGVNLSKCGKRKVFIKKISLIHFYSSKIHFFHILLILLYFTRVNYDGSKLPVNYHKFTGNLPTHSTAYISILLSLSFSFFYKKEYRRT